MFANIIVDTSGVFHLLIYRISHRFCSIFYHRLCFLRM